MELAKILEALLFASQKPISVKELSTVLKAAVEASPDEEAVTVAGKAKPAEIEKALDALRHAYEEEDRAFMLVEQASGWQVVSRPEYAGWVRQLYPENRPTRLSAPALETLAIIAYRQPITRADLEAVRGVSVDGVMQTLLDRGLVRIAGRADVPGRPLLYDTTQAFLDHFGLKDLDELPNSDELRQVKLPTAEPVEESGERQLELTAPDEAGPQDAEDLEGNGAKAQADDEVHAPEAEEETVEATGADPCAMGDGEGQGEAGSLATDTGGSGEEEEKP